MSNAVKKSGVALVAPRGERSATGSATNAPSVGTEVKCWSANRKKEVLLFLLRAESIDVLSRELGIQTYRLEG